MKFLKLIVIAAIMTGIAACKKAQLTTVNASNDDAAILLAGSLASNTYGMSNLSADISTNALALSNKNLSCGAIVIDSSICKSLPGSAATYSYKLNYTNKLNCNADNLPDNLTQSLTYSGNFSGPKLTITNSGTTSYHIGGLTPSSTVHVFNGEYKNSAHFKFKSDTTNTGVANIYLGVKNLTILKASHSIISGTAMVIVTGNSTKKSNFTYNGSLTFNGANTATLTLNGNDYTIDVYTGEVTKK